MKKVRLLTMAVFFLATAVLFSSCSKSNEKLIVGSWRITQVFENSEYVDDYNNQVWGFKSNGACSSTFLWEDYNIQGTYSLYDTSLSLNSGYVYHSNGWYKVSLDLEIIELSRNNMRVSGYCNLTNSAGGSYTDYVVIQFKKVK